MKLIRIVATIVISLAVINLNAQDQITLKDQKDKISYSIGVNLGATFKQQGIDVNPAVLIAGFKDALSGSKTALTEAEVQQTLMAFQREMMSKQAEHAKELGEKNKKEGESFLTENKKKQGVKTTASGLQYKVITEGKGKRPAATDTVRVHYKGTFLDGSEFDSSYKHGEPAEFGLAGGVIPGWTEAVQLMAIGSKWQLFIPPSLAYGEQGYGRTIGPNSTLIFEVELLAVVDEPKTTK
jgi:FKBP-type peptidyl-prolyl cis-trans isomerase FklB